MAVWDVSCQVMYRCRASSSMWAGPVVSLVMYVPCVKHMAGRVVSFIEVMIVPQRLMVVCASLWCRGALTEPVLTC